jgi:hypothetical protein
VGVCQVKPEKENYQGIDIRTPDDLLEHFLCISNSESRFGQTNIGMGGRGPWGIHPMHNSARGKICYGLQSVVRSGSREIKKNEAYKNPKVIRDNAACALRLYQMNGPGNGFKPWGTGSAWGSNRHCSKATRKKFQFGKYLGALSCCSEECKRKYGKAEPKKQKAPEDKIEKKAEVPTEDPIRDLIENEGQAVAEPPAVEDIPLAAPVE